MVNDKFYMIQPTDGGKFVVISTEDIIVSGTGCVTVSGYKINEGVTGQICLISAGNVVNQGTLSCDTLNGGKAIKSTIYVDAKGAFKNEGMINGETGSVHIECTRYVNTGVISPAPNVIIKNAELNAKQVFRDMTQRENQIKLNI